MTRTYRLDVPISTLERIPGGNIDMYQAVSDLSTNLHSLYTLGPAVEAIMETGTLQGVSLNLNYKDPTVGVVDIHVEVNT